MAEIRRAESGRCASVRQNKKRVTDPGRSSKFKAQSSKEAPILKLQADGVAWRCFFGAWDFEILLSFEL
jgi:hypothetical protein